MGFLLGLLKNPAVLKGVGIILILALVAGIILFQRNSIDKLELRNDTLEVKNKIATASIKGHQQVITTIQEESNRRTEILVDQIEFQRTIDRITQEEVEVFEGHDLGNLANKKSSLIELRANKATERVFKQLEEETTAFIERSR